MLAVAASDISDHIHALSQIRGPHGRPAYSDLETAAMRYVEALGVAIGATSSWDRVGNLTLQWRGKSDRFIEVGSHLDTVPAGGNYDGTVGIVAGLVAIKAVTESEKTLRHGLKLRIWRGEESGSFGKAYLGSLAAFGQLEKKYLDNVFDTVRLGDAMTEQGVDLSLFEGPRRPTIPQDEVDAIIAHFEQHIEQGKVLEVRGNDIGAATSIRGARRYRFTVIGKPDHSGATPMGREFRSDALEAAALMVTESRRLIMEELRNGHDLVRTASAFESKNNTSTISSLTEFTMDFRGNNNACLDRYVDRAIRCMKEVACAENVELRVQFLSESRALEELNPALIDVVCDSARSLDLSCFRLPCGAGHDVAVIGAQRKSDDSPVPVNLSLIPCRDGISHNPEEFSSLEHMHAGARTLAASILELLSHEDHRFLTR